MPFGWGANPNWVVDEEHRLTSPRCHQCLSAGGLIQTPSKRPERHGNESMSPMPFGWGANPNVPLHLAGLGISRPGHQCLSAGGLIQT